MFRNYVQSDKLDYISETVNCSGTLKTIVAFEGYLLTT